MPERPVGLAESGGRATMTLSPGLHRQACEWRPAGPSKRLLLTLSPAILYLSRLPLSLRAAGAAERIRSEFTLEHYRHLVEVPIYRAVMINTFEISITVAILCLLLAYPTAYVLVMAPPWLGRILIVFVMLPFLASALVRNYAWIFLLGARGVVNATLMRWGLIGEPLPLIFNRAGVLIGMTNILLPYTILVLISVMRGIRRDPMTAAESLMASPFTAFRRVFLPLSLPGVGASAAAPGLRARARLLHHARHAWRTA